MAGVEFSAILNNLPVIKDVVTSVASLAAVVIATKGLTTWRRQLEGNTEYELSRRLLGATLQLEDSIALVRDPVTYIDSPMKKSLEKEFHGGKYVRKEILLPRLIVHVVRLKLDELQGVLAQWQMARREAQVVWGDTIGPEADEILGYVRELRDACNSLYVAAADSSSETGAEEFLSLFNSCEATISSSASGDDFQRRVRCTVSRIEAKMRKRLGTRR